MKELIKKVAIGLECCNKSIDYNRKGCKTCPYNHKFIDDEGYLHLCENTKLRADALIVIKSIMKQEIREGAGT